MGFPPFVLTDIGFLFAVSAIILLITAELSSSYYGQNNFNFNKNNLRFLAYAVGVLFVIVFVGAIITRISL
jgi:hypothetical protein